MEKNPPFAGKNFQQPTAPPGEETLDAIFGGEVKLYQSRRGYRFSLDSILLARFATVRAGEKVMDLGTGSGVIPVILAYLYPSIFITGLEIQQSMAARAWRNVELNGHHERVKIACMDVSSAAEHFLPESFNAVICNPPYRPASSGRLSPSSEKQIARHEVKAALDDFIRAAAFLLMNKGRFTCIHLAHRSVDVLTTMRSAGIEPKRLKMVHPFAETEASMILVEGIKGGRRGIEVLSPLIIYNDVDVYSAEANSMLSGKSPFQSD